MEQAKKKCEHWIDKTDGDPDKCFRCKAAAGERPKSRPECAPSGSGHACRAYQDLLAYCERLEAERDMLGDEVTETYWMLGPSRVLDQDEVNRLLDANGPNHFARNEIANRLAGLLNGYWKRSGKTDKQLSHDVGYKTQEVIANAIKCPSRHGIDFFIELLERIDDPEIEATLKRMRKLGKSS